MCYGVDGAMNKNFSYKMDCFMDEYYKNNKNSGVLRVTVKDEIIYEKFIGLADIENNVNFSKKSMFTLYSISKAFCAIGLMKFADKGLIDINRHPGVYLQEAKDFPKELTIRHLLWHVSGIPDIDQNTDYKEKYKGETSEQLREQIKLLTKEKMMFAPGTEAQYTNTNYIICALIIESVSGIKYADYMKEEIFSPLGMYDTCIYHKGLLIENMVCGYEMDDECKIKRTERVSERILGAADVVSTVSDVYLLNKLIKKKLILSSEAWNEILTPNPLNFKGFGCTVNKWHGRERIVHNGGWTGFRTMHVYLPENDFDIVFLSNSGWGNARKDIIEAVYRIYYGDSNEKSDELSMDAGYIR